METGDQPSDEKSEAQASRNSGQDDVDADVRKRTNCPSPRSQGEEEAIEQWNRWVPMDRNLFHAVQNLHLCMLQKLDEMLNEASIPYWICGGTLIGAIRHMGFVPHDDDVDIEICKSDIPKLVNIPLSPPFYTGFKQFSGTWEGTNISKLQFYHGEFEVDIFQRDNGFAEMTKFPSKEEIFPLSRYNFHNIQVWGPCKDKCQSYLDRCYGTDWRDTVCVYNHDFNYYHTKAFDERKVVLSLNDYNNIISQVGLCVPIAEVTANKSFERFCNQYGDTFLDQYRSYRTQRTFRWNKSNADWNYEQSLLNESS